MGDHDDPYGTSSYGRDNRSDWENHQRKEIIAAEVRKELEQEAHDKDQDSRITKLETIVKNSNFRINALSSEIQDEKKKRQALRKKFKALSTDYDEEEDWTEEELLAISLLIELFSDYLAIYGFLKKRGWLGRIKWGAISTVGAGLALWALSRMRTILGV